MADKNLHAGHRARLRKEFENGGFKNWHEHKVLEYILQRVIPRADTNETAHMLINACGSFADVFRSPKEQLVRIKGVGEETAAYLSMLGEFVHYYNGVRFDANKLVLDSDNCREYLLNLFDGKEREYFYMICLDAKYRILRRELIFEGSFESMDVDMSRIIRTAVKSDASKIVMSHNHPSGMAKASDADIVSTLAAERALNVIGVELLDHIIVAGGVCVSMRESLDKAKNMRYKRRG